MTCPANIADLQRLEDDIEEALISSIDTMIAELKRRKLHLLRHQAVENERSN
jgi:hypothetical protein